MISQGCHQQNCYLNCSSRANENWKLILEKKFQVFPFQCFFSFFHFPISITVSIFFLINEKLICTKPLCNKPLLLPVYIFHFCIFKNWEQEEEGAWQIEQAKQDQNLSLKTVFQNQLFQQNIFVKKYCSFFHFIIENPSSINTASHTFLSCYFGPSADSENVLRSFSQTVRLDTSLFLFSKCWESGVPFSGNRWSTFLTYIWRY